jgi:hypothetical protein
MVLFRTTKESTDYVIEAERDAEAQTVFFIRSLPLRLAVWLMDNLEDHFAMCFELAVRAGIGGWRDPESEDGEAIESKQEKGQRTVCGQRVTDPLTVASYEAIPADVAQELFRQVLIVNRLQKEDVGN